MWHLVILALTPISKSMVVNGLPYPWLSLHGCRPAAPAPFLGAIRTDLDEGCVEGFSIQVIKAFCHIFEVNMIALDKNDRDAEHVSQPSPHHRDPELAHSQSVLIGDEVYPLTIDTLLPVSTGSPRYYTHGPF